MKKLTLGLCFALSMIGCGGGKADKMLEEYQGFATKMCACKDQACADAVDKEVSEWQKNNRKSDMKETDISKEQQAHGKKIRDELKACRSKVPSTP